MAHDTGISFKNQLFLKKLIFGLALQIVIYNGSRNVLSGNFMHLKISKNEYAYRFQRTRIGIEQVFWFDLGFAGR